jgi:hypothetical protein
MMQQYNREMVSVRSVQRLHKEPNALCELVRQLEAIHFGPGDSSWRKYRLTLAFRV